MFEDIFGNDDDQPDLDYEPTTFKGTTFGNRQAARWAVFFDAMGLTWHYQALVEQEDDAVMAFELPTLAASHKRFIIATWEPEEWAVRLADVHGAGVLVGEPRLEQDARESDRIWYKILVRRREQYVFAVCRSCGKTIEMYPAFFDAGARYVACDGTAYSYPYSRGEGWGVCNCDERNERPPIHDHPRLLQAMQIAQAAY